MTTETTASSVGKRAGQSIVDVFRREQRNLLIRLVLLAVLVLVLGQSAVSWFALDGFEQELDPQLHQKATVVGNALAEQFTYATEELEIPVQHLVGVDEYFESVLMANDDIKYLSLFDESGNLLFVSGISRGEMNEIMQAIENDEAQVNSYGSAVGAHFDSTFEVSGGDGANSNLHVGVSSERVRSHLREIFLEVITIVVICWLVTFEFLLFFIVARVEKPMETIWRIMSEGARGKFSSWLPVRSSDEIGRLITSFNRTLYDLRHRYSDFVFDVKETQDAQIDTTISEKIEEVHHKIKQRFQFEQGRIMQIEAADRIRVPLFLFIFSEELTRSFLPLYVQKYAPTDLMLSTELLIGLPITLFMVAAMVATPLGGGFVDRVGVKKVFLTGTVLAIIGFIGNFYTQGYTDLVLFRVVTGIGYGLVFIASESWVSQNARRHSRASATGVFVAAVFAGIICGPPIGGILADRFGFEATFLFSASLAVISGLIIFQVFGQSEKFEEDSNQQRTRPALILGFKGWLTLLKDLRFVSVLIFAAIPGKMMVAGFVAYLVPLYLNDLGHNEPSIGRILMLYGIATLLCLTIGARFADRTEKYGTMVSLGTIIAGLGCLAALLSNVYVDPTTAVVLAIASLGVGHALTLTSQNSIIQQVAERYRYTLGRASVIGAYRLCERLGMVAGPMIAVALISGFGYVGAIVGFGVILIGLISLFVITNLTKANTPMETEVGLANE